MTIPLKQVIQAIEEANEVFTSFWDTKIGKTVYLADPLMIASVDKGIHNKTTKYGLPTY